MVDELVRNLASRVGVSTIWRDQTGSDRVVSIGTLRHILHSLGYPSESEGEVRNALSALDAGVNMQSAQSHFATARVGQPVALPVPAPPGTTVEVTYESGATRVVSSLDAFEGSLTLPPFDQPGYHSVHLPTGTYTVATAPERCISFLDLNDGRPGWGAAAQVYSLRTPNDSGAGDFGGVAALARAAGRLGADLLAISPVHALFGAEPRHYSPYSPSTRLFYNPVYADPYLTLPDGLVREAAKTAAAAEALAGVDAGPLIDWPSAHRAKLSLLAAVYKALLQSNDPMRAEYEYYLANASQTLRDHALFEALHAGHLKRSEPQWDWRHWADGFRRPDAPDSLAFAQAHKDEIDFQIFLQWLTGRSYGEAQRNAKEAGMKVGLVADLAIGMAPSGSHAWSRQSDVLHGLGIGAPPDYYSTEGQSWGVTTFSPRGLAASGYEPFIETLRACLRHAGGIRIDHIMGMSRLWLVPDGASAVDGAYVAFPSETMFRLAALESWRHRAIVIGEDLGTLPYGFQGYLEEQGVAGMRVLRFEKNGDFYKLPQDWTPSAVAMTSTHDMIATAGWWRGLDIDDGQGAEAARRARAWDRGLLWSALQAAEVVAGGERPADDDATPVVDAAFSFVAKTPCQLKVVPIEDLLASDIQPNTPGTTSEKPNWRHRFAAPAERLLSEPGAEGRAARLGPPRAQS